jgi:hypothetical protein
LTRTETRGCPTQAAFFAASVGILTLIVLGTVAIF